MKTVKQQMQKLRVTAGVQLNGRRYVNYNSFMWLLGQSDHPRQLDRKQVNYPAHFITINDQPFVTEDYARYVLIQHYTARLHQALKSGHQAEKGGGQ